MSSYDSNDNINEKENEFHLFLLIDHGVQRRIISVDNFYVFLDNYFLLCCCYM